MYKKYFSKLNNLNKFALINLLVYTLIVLISNFITIDIYTQLKIHGIYLVIDFFLFLWFCYQSTNKIVTPFNLFYLVFVLFTAGHLFLMGIGFAPGDISYIWEISKFNKDIILTSVCFTIYSIDFFQLGYSFSPHVKFNVNVTRIININYQLIIKILFILSIVSAIGIALYLKIATQNYSDIYNYSYGTIYNILYSVSLFCIPFYLLIQYDIENSQWFYFSNIFMLVVIILNLILGRRGISLMFFIPIFFVMIRKFKKINVKFIVILCVSFYLIVNLLVTISYSRIENGSFFDFIIFYFQKLISLDSIKLLISEMGFSIRPLLEIITMSNEGAINPVYGGSYIYSILLILPGILRFNLDSIAVQYNLVNLSSLITKYSEANFGLGFSMPAEAFLNFHIFGVFIFILFGMLIGVLLNEQLLDNKKLSYYFNICVTSFLITLPRNPMQDSIRKILIYCIIPFFLYLYCSHNKEDKKIESTYKNN